MLHNSGCVTSGYTKTSMSYVNIGHTLKVHQVLPQMHAGKLQH